MFLIVGLGNPGTKYEKSRHNIGFMVVDEIINNLFPSLITKKEFKGLLYKDKNLLLLKPTTFMNLSGLSVAAVKNFFKIENDKIVVIHDDIDLCFGAIKFKKDGGNGGHNGLKSIDEHIKNDYIRVRIGIGKPKDKSQIASYVLSDFSKEEKRYLKDIIKKAATATLALTQKSLDEVRSKFSQKGLIKEGGC